ncbi:diol dehydratase reactivase subunit alpha [Clostridium estertheticum]|uniref:diol dehydratase reactivase subunit alpha n=1 Tax=Clostridium estertheticum TaxID=238834 RepID=UPI0013E944EB|nr:diol dehydratase reactivase subunit alpha [Clostridium estertheticum]MBZ9686046.1 diol dehydratase reactivase subunit alpha [Clostridium estertheticum]
MKFFAGVDIGNSTTEVCIASVNEKEEIDILSSSLTTTTGVKGTIKNVEGIITALKVAMDKIGKDLSDLDSIRLNEAAPVIGDTAMETITETIITESTMIGHNPSTPGGTGLGIGELIRIDKLDRMQKEKSYIVVIPESVDYEIAASAINVFTAAGYEIVGAIAQKDEGVLISNRLTKIIPILDEVKYIDKLPLGIKGAVEVADSGFTIHTLSNPYGIASIFNLSADETGQIVPVAKSLVGTRSAVVIKTPKGQVKEKVIPSGSLYIHGATKYQKIDVDAGAVEIMKALAGVSEIKDIEGESGTNIGGMISGVKNVMAELIGTRIQDVKIRDLLAIDTNLPVRVQGGIAGETFMEKAVAVAAMVKADKIPMIKVASVLSEKLGARVNVAGVEAVMASLGALTTPGVKLPLGILDLGGGSTDAAVLDEKGVVKSTHLAGAGELVTMLINSELGLKDRTLAEEIKKNPIAKVESLYHIRMENREVKFFNSPIDSKFFGRLVVLKKEMIPIYADVSLEKIVEVRRSAKKRVFVENALRALKDIAPMNNLRNIPNIVLVGGSALDFEIPEMIMSELSKYKIVAGRGNIRALEGPRNAVATGLILSYISS